MCAYFLFFYKNITIYLSIIAIENFEYKGAKFMAFLSQTKQDELAYYLPEEKAISRLADLFSMFGDATRIKIITALCLSDMCVSDLSELLSINQTTVSHQLKVLKNFELVKSTRLGKMIYYSITTKCISEMMSKGVDLLLANDY